MFRILITLLTALLLSPLAGYAAKGDDVVLFARYEPSRDTLTEGDSIVVNLVLYSNCAFQRAECSAESVKVKGGHLRQLPRRGERKQQRVRLSEGVYYSILWESYVVGSEKVGDVKFPQLQFDCEVEVMESEVYADPFDPFGFFSRPRHKSHKAKASCKCPAFELPVVARPKRSTQEIISSGRKVI